MKKIIAVLAAILVFSLAVTAQTTTPANPPRQKSEIRRHHPGKNHRHRKIRRFHRRHHRRSMAEQLQFSDQQKATAHLYRQDFRNKMKALNQQENITVKEQRDQKAALKKEQQNKMQSLLSPAQKDKLAAMKANRKADAALRYQSHLDAMKTKLNLSDKQVTALQAQRTATMEKIEAIKANDQLDRQAKKEQLMAVKNDMKADREKIFTAEQQKKLEALKQAHMQKAEAK